jgi:hypothetical protein
MKKRDKRKRAKRHQIAKSQQIVEEILETEKLKAGVGKVVLDFPDGYLFENDEKLWDALLGNGGGRKTGSEN